MAANCTRSSDTKCNGTCIQGYYYTKKPRHDCLRCAYCCFDGKDEIQQECVNQGLNTVKQHCSHRMDKICVPDPTTMIIPETQPPAHTPANTLVNHHSHPIPDPTTMIIPETQPPAQTPANTLVNHHSHPTNQGPNPTTMIIPETQPPAHTPANTLANHHSHPTNQGHGKVAVIVSSVAVGLLFAVIVVGVMRKMRKIQRRKRSPQLPISVAMNVNGTQATQGQSKLCLIS